MGVGRGALAICESTLFAAPFKFKPSAANTRCQACFARCRASGSGTADPSEADRKVGKQSNSLGNDVTAEVAPRGSYLFESMEQQRERGRGKRA